MCVSIGDLKNILSTNYSDCFKKITEVAKDTDNGVEPLQNENTVLNFDEDFAKKFINITEFRAVDMLDIQNNEINLIEFKNGDLNKDHLKVKGVESLIVLHLFLKKDFNISEFKKIFELDINYYVVFNGISNPRVVETPIVQQPRTNAKNRNRVKRLEILARLYPFYESTYFKKVRIMNFENFEQNYLDKYYP